MDTTYDVIIVGGGIAGSAMARELRRQGVSALILEKRRSHSDGGLAINLPGNAMAALALMGCDRAIADHGKLVTKREYRTVTDRLLFTVDERDFWGANLTPRCVRRTDLLAVLRDGLAEGALRFESEVVSIEGDVGDIAVITEDGLQFRCRILVGADGIHSSVREQRFRTGSPQYSHLATSSWRFMAPNLGVDGWTFWADSRAMLLLIAVGDEEVYGWVALNNEAGLTDELKVQTALSVFPENPRRAFDWAVSHGRLHRSPLEEVELARWSENGVILIGDAAHATAPVWAQGAAMGMEDAIILSRLLGSRTDWALVGEEYQKIRHARVQHVKAMTERMSRAARLPAYIRNLIMPFMGPRSYCKTFEPLKLTI